MKDEFDRLYEWAVWGHLNSKTDLELILLKGHLLLEAMIGTALVRNNIHDSNDFSFYRKVKALESIGFQDNAKKDFIIHSLTNLNKLRNKLAHDFHFDITNGELESWALCIIRDLKGEKYTKYTFRTKIVHSFSILSKNILELN
tara:strand:+ start:868 stop:1299 length:432 start_codon:yes stop_codon:yes gene_type:complete